MFDFLFYDPKSPLLFTQAAFWIFFAFVVLFYQFYSSRIFLRNAFLTLVSLYFYYKSSGFYFFLLILSTLIDYHIGSAIYRSQNPSQRKTLLILSLVSNLVLLGYFKYTFFFADTINSLFGLELKPVNLLAAFMNLLGDQMDTSDIFLPVGISFYTFQTMSYTIDIYRSKLKPVDNMLDFAFYVSFFPQLVAGPIVRAADFVPQIYKKFSLTVDEYNRAIFLIVNGLIKKILISDYLSVNFVDQVFSEPGRYSGFENLLATYGYSIQIYCDFSGYTDIAIGVSLLLGFRLNLNFNSPYKSVSITEFWRRWHISLSSWLRDYLYISLGGNRKGRIRTYINLLITMLLGGLWHGANLRFVIWGALHGLALALHKIYMELTQSEGQPETLLSRLFWGLVTFHFVAFCWIFFRAEDLAKVQMMLYQIGFNFGWPIVGSVCVAYWKAILIMALGFGVHLLPETIKEHVRREFYAMPDLVKAGSIMLIILLLYQIRSAGFQPFIYFQF
jgi:D-alanyl-lipoteichoic acid acyltransferase DltB (MBOAT superfamily)